MDHDIRSREEVKENSSDSVAMGDDPNLFASEIRVERSTGSKSLTGEGLDLNEERTNSLEPVASETDDNEKSSISISGENLPEMVSADGSCSICKDDDFGGMSENSLKLLASVGNEGLSDLITSETLKEIKSAERICSSGKDDDFEGADEDSSNSIASIAVGNQNSSHLLTFEPQNETRYAESRYSAGKDDDLKDTDENSLNPIAVDTPDKKNSSSLVTLETLNEVRFAESRCLTGKNNDLEDTGESSLNPIAGNTPDNEKSCNLVTLETLNAIRFQESGCSTGKNNDLEDIGEDSLNSIAINTVGKENTSNLVTLETLKERKIAERSCPTGKYGDMEDIGENSSNLIASASASAVVVNCTETECLASESRISKAKTNSLEGKIPADKMKVNLPDPVKGPCLVIDVGGGDRRLDNGDCDGEKVCRICHLGSEHQLDDSDVIQLGCNCKDELGIAHRHCAEAWFRLKGSRWCEICGQSAKNVTGVGENRIVELWNERRMIVISRSSHSERARCWPVQPCCNFLLACLVIAFVLPWFFRVNMF